MVFCKHWNKTIKSICSNVHLASQFNSSPSTDCISGAVIGSSKTPPSPSCDNILFFLFFFLEEKGSSAESHQPDLIKQSIKAPHHYLIVYSQKHTWTFFFQIIRINVNFKPLFFESPVHRFVSSHYFSHIFCCTHNVGTFLLQLKSEDQTAELKTICCQIETNIYI